MCYLYRHIRLDKNEPFYVGIGSDLNYKRANSLRQRNRYWKYITAKTDYRVEIVLGDLTWEEACEKEIEFIEIYGRKDLNKGSLCNMTIGGEGAKGRISSLETRAKISAGVSGEKHPMFGKNHTEESRKKISNTLSNIPNRYNEEWRKKISISLTGRKRSEKYLLNADRSKWNSCKKVIDTNTGFIYNSIVEAAKAFNIHEGSLHRYLKGTRKNKTSLAFLI